MSMTQYVPPYVPIETDRSSSALAAEHRWISKGSTLNPAPGALQKERRDTAEGCCDRAAADLLEAVSMTTAHSRQMLERSAASWSARAELLLRIEGDVETRRDTFKLTATEIAEDTGYLRL
jgi:hypothetical protein